MLSVRFSRDDVSFLFEFCFNFVSFSFRVKSVSLVMFDG